jgi:hypothetical protein
MKRWWCAKIWKRIRTHREAAPKAAEFLFVAFDDRATFPAGAPILTQAAAPMASAGHNSSGPGP